MDMGGLEFGAPRLSPAIDSNMASVLALLCSVLNNNSMRSWLLLNHLLCFVVFT